MELGEECKLEIDGICKLEIDGTSKYEMEANENAILEIMDTEVLCELPVGNTTPIDRTDEKESRDEKEGREDSTGRSNGNAAGVGNEKRSGADNNTAEPVVVEIRHVKRCELNVIKNIAKGPPKDDYDNHDHPRAVERKPGGVQEEGGWF